MRRRSAQRWNICASILAWFVASSALALSAAHASPWARQDGRFFISTRTDYFIATADAPIAPATVPARFNRVETNAYLEFGLTRTTTLGGKVAYGSSTFADGFSESAASGFSEIEAFVQREILRDDKQALSLKFTGAAPTHPGAGARADLSSSGVDLDLRVLYGRNLMRRPFKVFATAEAGYRRRFGDAADQLRADFLIGAEPAKRALLLLEIMSATSVRNEDSGGADYDVLKIQPSVVWRFSPRWSLQAGVTREVAGRNLLLGDTFFLGVWALF